MHTDGNETIKFKKLPRLLVLAAKYKIEKI
jgi:hypothetical protein